MPFTIINTERGGGNLCTATVIPPAIINGITVTGTQTGSVQTYPSAYSSCNGAVNTPVNSIYLGQSGPFTYTLNFDQPINNVVIAITATGHNVDEVFTFTTNTEVPLVTANVSCFTSIVGNTIYSGTGAPPGPGGGGVFVITSLTNYTSVTISGPGGDNGSLLSVCANSVVVGTCNVNAAPLLSATSLGSSCPITTVDLNSITASNAPVFTGVSLTWHTAQPATAANQLTVAQASAATAGPTYYAAFYDSVNDCYGGAEPLSTFLNAVLTPAFTQVAPICAGTTLAALPAVSNNNVTGSWSPALNNNTTTTYIFQPAVGQCALTATMTIVVNPVLTPLFDTVDPVCSGTTIQGLPTVSNNGIPGVWSPALSNTTTTDYTFVPNNGQCANNASLQIVINETPTVSITGDCVGIDYVLTAHSDFPDLSYEWFNNAHVSVGNQPTLKVPQKGIYQVIVTSADHCDADASFAANSIYCDIQKGISPNGDGNNDFFDLTNLGVHNLEIFNRYGMLVYDKHNYKNEWYGTTNSGKKLPDSTYYYVIRFETGQSKTGWIYINKPTN